MSSPPGYTEFATLHVIGGTSDGRRIKVEWPLSGGMTAIPRIRELVTAYEEGDPRPTGVRIDDAFEVYRVVEVCHPDHGHAFCLLLQGLEKVEAVTRWTDVFAGFREGMFERCNTKQSAT